MKTTTEIKQFCKNVLGVKVKGNTSAGKQHWQGVYIPPNPSAHFTEPLTWPAKFPEDFRRICIKVVYPNSPTLHEQPSAGNIEAYRIAMLPQEWEQAITEYQVTKA